MVFFHDHHMDSLSKRKPLHLTRSLRHCYTGAYASDGLADYRMPRSLGQSLGNCAGMPWRQETVNSLSGMWTREMILEREGKLKDTPGSTKRKEKDGPAIRHYLGSIVDGEGGGNGHRDCELALIPITTKEEESTTTMVSSVPHARRSMAMSSKSAGGKKRKVIRGRYLVDTNLVVSGRILNQSANNSHWSGIWSVTKMSHWLFGSLRAMVPPRPNSASP
ncbi:hypothetical protein BDP55DRAFT_228831 [Colletotrichum godetiae]|uniref:Uncharacterized protein n=1 Tax=Colletotrichum godetiae TaxID=1209918 RepID=A0AAJ0AG47_9PEZI|nr:uncharacterized protein BDP55DRAFT_228831 [Colletotrichum godetiae]KAK1673275.1 hypothetical protein BDP55DRAFT_228831 [Colletotrichum godetiae]